MKSFKILGVNEEEITFLDSKDAAMCRSAIGSTVIELAKQNLFGQNLLDYCGNDISPQYFVMEEVKPSPEEIVLNLTSQAWNAFLQLQNCDDHVKDVDAVRFHINAIQAILFTKLYKSNVRILI